MSESITPRTPPQHPSPIPTPPSPVVGRFAPSPTGELHLGSLTTAVASYCHIKSLQGRWLLRIEDTDIVRCDTVFSDRILMDLDRLGLHWDGDVIYQSERTDLYQHYLAEALHPLSYPCTCSRKQLAQYQQRTHRDASHFDNKSQATDSQTSNSQIYPRLCLSKTPDYRQPHKTRLQLPDHWLGFDDGIQGIHWQNPQQLLGDVVVRRQDGVINYILACSIDDGLQEVTHVMRGLDILPMTAAQISLMQACGLSSVQHWYHLPLIANRQGQKLSKQNLATPIDTRDPSQLLAKAIRLLKQPDVDPDTPERMLAQAVAQWQHLPLLGQTWL